MRTYWKYGILLLLILPGIWLLRLLFLRPINIEHFFDRTMLLYALDNPEYLSTTRILDQYGINSHRKHLDDISVSSLDRAQRFFKQSAATFQAYDRADLSETEVLSYDIFTHYLNSQLQASGLWRFYDYPLNQMTGVQIDFPSFMHHVHGVENKGEARDYVARLYAVREKFAQLIEGLTIRQEKGIVPPDFILERVLQDMRDFMATPARENILYQSFETKLLASKLKEKDRAIYLQGAEDALRDAVYPSYTKLIAATEQLAQAANADAGVWKWPNGDAYYRYILTQHTSLDWDPEAVHQLGLKELARIHRELQDLLVQAGYPPTPSVGASLTMLAKDPRFYYSDDAAGRDEILRDYKLMIEAAIKSLGGYFVSMPKLGVKVERLPQFMEGRAPSAVYAPPSLDGKRPGIFYVNLGDIRKTVKFGMRTRVFHELVPGHHLETATHHEMQSLSLFRQEVNFPAFVQGWALYAEKLAFAASLEKNAFDAIGQLQAELLHAALLVVDTGIHAKRWKRQEAIEYLKAEAGLTLEQATREVDRVVVMPGEACAYTIGLLKFMQLRSQAQAALGSKFDIKEFHRLILENGAMPFALLEEQVGRWLTRLRGGTHAS